MNPLMEKQNPVTTITRQTDCRYAKVLLLDDNPVDNLVNRKMLQSAKFAGAVLAYESGYDALTYLRNEPVEQLPEIIFLDILMPKMDGFQFLDEFATLPEEIRSRVRVIMLSTSDSFQHLNRANKNKYVYRFLNKPLTEEVLSAIHC
jgi:CheY-like chemotaxis protein